MKHLEERRQRFIGLLKKSSDNETDDQKATWNKVLNEMPLDELRATYEFSTRLRALN